jgi:pimeloyl-ACP methyl ester carboxylesterase
LSAGTIPTNLTRLYDTLKHEVPDIASLPLHGVGYSLGGALLVKPSPIPFASLTLIATPTSVRLSLLQILSEIIGFVYPHVLKLATDYGFWSLLPALLNFKRTEYPIRLVQNGDYIAEITKIFDDLALNDTAEMRECPIHLIYGTHDLIATQKDCQTLAKSINNATVTIRKRRSHLSIMLDREMGNLIADWTSKSEIQPDFPGAKN